MKDDKLVADGQYDRKRNFLEQTGLQKKKSDNVGLATSRWCYIKHVGYNNIEVSFAC